MKYTKFFLLAIAAAVLTGCGSKKNDTPNAAPQAAAPVVSVVTAQAEDVDVTVSTDTVTSYSYYYSMNSGSVEYYYNSY